MTERPVECGQCKKAIKIIYKEMIEGRIILTEMCSDCPILQEKLGSIYEEPQKSTHLLCENCKTSLESIKRGEPLGCAECYTFFAEVLIEELTTLDKIPLPLIELLKQKPAALLHRGKAPGKATSFISSFISFDNALKEALQHENFEQAAWLRDQIKSLKEPPHDKKS